MTQEHVHWQIDGVGRPLPFGIRRVKIAPPPLYYVHGRLLDEIISLYLLMSWNVKLSDGVITNNEVGESSSFKLQ